MDVSDLPSPLMYPQDSILEVGGNVTVCCIIPNKTNIRLMYGKRELVVTRLSPRSYSATITNLQKSSYTGTNAVCYSETTMLAGTVLFIGRESHCPPVSLSSCLTVLLSHCLPLSLST